MHRVGDANRYCFVSSGGIIEWDHEVPEDRSPVDLSFADLLMREIRELEERKDRKVLGHAKSGA